MFRGKNGGMIEGDRTETCSQVQPVLQNRVSPVSSSLFAAKLMACWVSGAVNVTPTTLV